MLAAKQEESIGSPSSCFAYGPTVRKPFEVLIGRRLPKYGDSKD